MIKLNNGLPSNDKIKELNLAYASYKDYQEDFKKYFKDDLYKYTDSLLIKCGVYGFDIIGFDNYLHSTGYSEDKHGSMKDYILKTYGDKAVKLIETLIIN